MSPKPHAIRLSPAEGAKWWEVPDFLWRRVSLVREARLRRVIDGSVLPLVQSLEKVYVSRNKDFKPRLIGRSLDDICSDDRAVELAIQLFDLALSTKLVAIVGRNGRPLPGAAGGRIPVGGCGLPVEAVRRRYLNIAGRAIVARAGREAGKLNRYISDGAITEIRHLERLRTLVQFDPLVMSELRGGLQGNLDGLLHADEAFITVLREKATPDFLRPLRHAVGDWFPRILKWSPEFLAATIEGLEHSSKLLAMGRSLFSISDPEVVRALGAWPVHEEVIRGSDGEIGEGEGAPTRTVTHIDLVRKRLGADFFRRLLRGDPGMIRVMGSWTPEALEEMKYYLEYLTPAALEVLALAPPEHKMSILDGLWYKIGRKPMATAFRHPRGIKMLREIAEELADMAARGNLPTNVQGLIVGDYFEAQIRECFKKG